MIFYQITRPLSYLSIEHPEKWKFDWLIPSVLSLLSLVVFYIIDNSINIFGQNGFISYILGLIQILPGFYIAALAAISTFNKNDIDQYMPDPTPQVDILVSGQKNKIKLTRRRFLCMLFAFLTTESIFLALLSIGALIFSSSLKALIPPGFHCISQFVFLGFYILVFWQLLTATLLGLYYLGDRLHQPD